MPFADEYNAMNKLVEALKSFGLSEYEAKALLTLLSKGELTAKEISELSGIPRTSVYDVMSSLESKGLVKSFGKPLRFRALKTDEILSILSKKVSDNLELLKRELPKLETDEEIEEVKVYRGDAVFGILRMLVGSAKERIQVLLSHISKDIEDIAEKLKSIKKDNFTCIFCKRKMLKIAEKYAKYLDCDAIVTGDNLGQVASQTLKNLRVIGEDIKYPILRPLIGLDKNDIVKIAKEIGTYEISTEKEIRCPYLPKHPKTIAKPEDIKKIKEKVKLT